MTTAKLDTVFCKAVFHKMEEHMRPVDIYFAKTLNKIADSDEFYEWDWRRLIAEIGDAIDRYQVKDRHHATRFITESLDSLTPEAIIPFRQLMYTLRNNKQFFKMWPKVMTDDTVYAFSLSFLCLWHPKEFRPKLNAIVSRIINAPFSLSDNALSWNDEFVRAVFGPAWHALYMDDKTSDVDFIHLLRQHRPPIMNRPLTACGNDSPLPLGLSI